MDKRGGRGKEGKKREKERERERREKQTKYAGSQCQRGQDHPENEVKKERGHATIQISHLK